MAVEQYRYDVAIVGGGAIGATIALELTRRGASVIVIERGDGWAAGCSQANAGLLCPSHAGHYASPDDVARAARWVLRRDSPFAIRPHPALVPFGARLLSTLRPRRLRRTNAILGELSRHALDDHAALAASGLETGFEQRGLLDVYATSRGFRDGLAAIGSGGATDSTPVSRSDLTALEPALESHCAGAVLHPHEAHCDPAAYVRAVGEAAVAAGASFAPATEVSTFEREGDGRVSLVVSTQRLQADVLVVAAGAHATRLARTCGVQLPLQAGKGYSVDLALADAPLPVTRPLMLQEARVAVTPLADRLRLAGTLELAGRSQRIDAPRVAAIRAAAEHVLPAARALAARDPWAGLRPCTPDGLPLVGWLSQRPPVAIAAGHAMLGLTLAPPTARLVADLVEGRRSSLCDALDPRRFRMRLGHRRQETELSLRSL